MLDPVRRIVSGRKARYTQDGFDLDLCRLTDRIIIMGFPAVGVASLYRNKRSDVLKFLEPYAPRYRIFNLCPLYENSYDAEVFEQRGSDADPDRLVREEEERALGGPVERYPWPDHHPPPLSLMRIMTEGVKQWYLQDDRNVVVIHCKAGKGRSGTFAISLLLALPGLPSAPTIVPTDEKRDAEEEYRALDPRGVLGKTDEEIKHLSLDDKLQYLLRFHTVRRMSPGAKKYGVSIASQRRFLGYWVRLLENRDPRQAPQAVTKPRRIVLEYVKVFGPGLGGMGKVLSGGNDKIAVQVWRYKDSIAAKLREKELALTTGDPASRPLVPNNDWDDRSEMLVRVGGLVESDDKGADSHLRDRNDAGGAVKRASTPPTAQSGRDPSASSSGISSASASTGSLPSALKNEVTSSSGSSTPLPPPSESAAQHPVRTTSESAKSRTLVPRTAYLAPPAALSASTTGGIGDGTSVSLSAEGHGNGRRRTEREAKEAVELEGGIVLDPDREIMLQFLVGKTGDRHAKLPVMASLALTWFIPTFETSSDPSGDEVRAKLVIEGKDLDFRKPFAGIDRIEVGWRCLAS